MISQATIAALYAIKPYQLLDPVAFDELSNAPLSDWGDLYAKKGAAFVGGAAAMVSFRFARVAPPSGGLAGGLTGLNIAAQFAQAKTAWANRLNLIFQTLPGVFDQYQTAFSKYYPESGGTFQQFLLLAAVAVVAVAAAEGAFAGAASSAPTTASTATTGATAPSVVPAAAPSAVTGASVGTPSIAAGGSGLGGGTASVFDAVGGGGGSLTSQISSAAISGTGTASGAAVSVVPGATSTDLFSSLFPSLGLGNPAGAVTAAASPIVAKAVTSALSPQKNANPTLPSQSQAVATSNTSGHTVTIALLAAAAILAVKLAL